MTALAYLDFEASEDTQGHGSFDAMASVRAERLPALQAEIEQVLAWAHCSFGPPGPLDGGALWDYALEASAETPGRPGHETALAVLYEPSHAALVIGACTPGGALRTTLSLTVSGTPAFCEAFARAFGLEG